MRKNKILLFIVGCFALLMSSCLGSNDTVSELGKDCEILTFTLASDSIEGLSSVVFTIDQLNGRIYNTDSLPYGTVLKDKVKCTVRLASTVSGCRVLQHEGEEIVDININKNEKTKIHHIYFTGNSKLSSYELKKAMKKTNEKFSLYNDWRTSLREMFSTKKFTTEEYENDKKNLISKYNEFGYRDAALLSDSVVNYDPKKVDIYLKIDEGDKYYLKNITFVGNTKYPSEQLQYLLELKPGDVYNQKKLNDRLSSDDDAVSNLYYNNGYIFFGADPVETDVENDSIALEIRIQEGPQATINRVIINGNDRLYEDIVRRELRTKPGMLFSREDLIRSVRELAQMGHFDPENMKQAGFRTIVYEWWHFNACSRGEARAKYALIP